MPTNQPKITINVGEDLDLKEIELREEERKKNEEVPPGKYDHIYVASKQNFQLFHGKCWAYKHRRGCPAFWHFALWFLPVLIFAALSPLPMFTAVVHPTKQIQNYPIATCSMISLREVPVRGYAGLSDYFVEVSYVDSDGNTHKDDINGLVGAEDDDLHENYQHYYESIYESPNRKFPCYYHSGGFVIATENVQYKIHYATHAGTQMAVGLVIAFSLLLICTLFLCGLVRPPAQRKITKDIYEKKKMTSFEVTDYGDVDPKIRQTMHAVLFAVCIPDENTEPQTIPGKTARFTVFARNDAYRHCLWWSIFIFMLMFMGGAVTLLRLSFNTHKVATVEIMWSLGVVALMGAVLLIVNLIRYGTRISFYSTAKIYNHKDNTEVTININGVAQLCNVDGAFFAGDYARIDGQANA